MPLRDLGLRQGAVRRRKPEIQAARDAGALERTLRLQWLMDAFPRNSCGTNCRGEPAKTPFLPPAFSAASAHPSDPTRIFELARRLHREAPSVAWESLAQRTGVAWEGIAPAAQGEYDR